MDASTLVLDSNVINERNFSRLKKRDSSALQLLESFPHVTVYRLETYTDNNDNKQRWIKLGAEGAALVAKFGRPPAIRLTILNKSSPLDFCLDISAIKRVKRSGENVMIRCNGGIDIGLGLGLEQDNCTFGMWVPDDSLRQAVEIAINKYINMTKICTYDTLLANMKINNAYSNSNNNTNTDNISNNNSSSSNITITDSNSNSSNKGDMLMKFLKTGTTSTDSTNSNTNNSDKVTNNGKGNMLMKFLKGGSSDGNTDGNTDSSSDNANVKSNDGLINLTSVFKDRLGSSTSTSASTSSASSPLTISGIDSKETVVNITSVFKQKLSSPELSKLGGNGDAVTNITSMMKGKLSSPDLSKLSTASTASTASSSSTFSQIPTVTLPPAALSSTSSLESLKSLIKVNSSPIINTNPDSAIGATVTLSSSPSSDLISPSDLLGRRKK